MRPVNPQNPLRREPPLSRSPAGRRDPAPTRMAYRFQRLWLTPFFRILFKIGVPVFIVTLAVGLWLSNEARRKDLVARVGAVRAAIEQRPEFMVGSMVVEGASADLEKTVRDLLAISFPVSNFALDVGAIHAKIAALDAVERVDVRVASGGVLTIAVTERQSAVVWREGDRLLLLDAGGRRVARITKRADRSDLPLIAGEAADLAVVEALSLLEIARPIEPRIRGLVRVGARRWDLVLDRNMRILLPARRPDMALTLFLTLAQSEDVLGRDILAIDLRNDQRPTLRLSPYALQELRRVQGVKPVESNL